MSNKEKVIDQLTSLTNDLFKLTFKRDKLIILDKRIDVAVEILNMLYNDINNIEDEITSIYGIVVEEKYQYKPSKPSKKNKLINYTKKQENSAKLFEYMIYTVSDKLFDIVNEDNVSIINIVEDNMFKHIANVIDFIENTSSYDEIIWDQALFNNIKIQIADDIQRSLYKPEGMKGIGICRQCQSENLQVFTKQTRSGDEGQSNEYNCLDCSFKWVVK